MNLFRVHQIFTALALLFAAYVALTGYAPGSPPREEVPASARNNPSAWRPVYARSTGYHPIPTSSGGYSFGK